MSTSNVNAIALKACSEAVGSAQLQYGTKVIRCVPADLSRLLLNDGQRRRLGWVQYPVLDDNLVLPPPDELLQGCQ